MTPGHLVAGDPGGVGRRGEKGEKHGVAIAAGVRRAENDGDGILFERIEKRWMIEE